MKKKTPPSQPTRFRLSTPTSCFLPIPQRFIASRHETGKPVCTARHEILDSRKNSVVRYSDLDRQEPTFGLIEMLCMRCSSFLHDGGLFSVYDYMKRKKRDEVNLILKC